MRTPPTASLRSSLRPLAVVVALAGTAAGADSTTSPAPQDPRTMQRTVRIAYLHHSTGGNVWKGGVPEFFQAWNAGHGTDYRITELTYPATTGGWPSLLRHFVRTYPWANYPYDYWNLWVSHRGDRRDRGELNLDDLVKSYDVIVLKHCYPVSRIEADEPTPSVSSDRRTLANYRLQYEALKARFAQFPDKKFIVWTGPALPERVTNAEQAQRAREWSHWVKTVWDRPGDNVFVWDFHALETDGGLYLAPAYATGASDAHPNPAFCRRVAPLIARRIVDVVEGRGDSGALTGEASAEGAQRVGSR